MKNSKKHVCSETIAASKRGKKPNNLAVVPTVLRHESLMSHNWEKLSKIVGYDPCSKEANVTLRNEHDERSHRNLKHKHRESHKKFRLHDAISKKPDGVEEKSFGNEELQNGLVPIQINGSSDADSSSFRHEVPLYKPELCTKTIAMDCEMVGTGPDGSDSMLARISIVNSKGQCVYDKYVMPWMEVTDYRTHVSGIRPANLKNGEKLKTVQKEVAEILEGKILVGHALKNDFRVLFLTHPRRLIRDTSRYKPFHETCRSRRPSLKKLAQCLLSITVQSGEHDSVEDARTVMQIYTQYKKVWEKDARRKKYRCDNSKND